jgi:hypothetical protein
VLLGPGAFDGGLRTALVGLAMHVAVAFTWAAVFLVLVRRAAWLRQILRSRYGVLEVAAVYGPFVWTVMSLVVIPVLVRRPPTINFRWWVQLVGHIPFVGLPIVAGIASSPQAGQPGPRG